MHSELDYYKEMSSLLNIGWWEANLTDRTFICSDYLCDAFHFDNGINSFDKFNALVHPDFRDAIKREVEYYSRLTNKFYKRGIPCYSPKYGEIILYAILVRTEEIDGKTKEFGYSELRINSDKNEVEKGNITSEKINDLLFRLNSISSSLFTFLNEESENKAINFILTEFLNIYHASRTYIFEFSEDKKIQRNIYEAVADGVEPQIKNLQHLLSSDISWWTNKILNNYPLMLDSINQLPKEAKNEYNVLASQNIKSILIVPMKTNNMIWGYLGIDIVNEYRTWANEDYQWISSLANIISICLELKRTKDRLTMSNTELMYNENLFKNIIMNIPVGVEVYDKDGYLIEINNEDMSIFGVSDKKDVIGIIFFDNPNASDELKEKFVKEDSFEYTFRFRYDAIKNYYKTNREGYVDIFTKVRKLYDSNGHEAGHIFLCITNFDQVLTKSRVRDFENFFSIISDYAKVGYAKINILTREGYAIKQWYKNMGEKENTPLSKIVGIYEQVHPDDKVEILKFLKDAEKGIAKDFRAEVRIKDQLNPNKWKWIYKNLILTKYAPDEKEIELIGVNYDITELKDVENNLAKARDKAETMDKLKSAFLANMSHEIRTPLNAIVGFSDLLADTVDVEERTKYINILHENNDLLLQLISDILDISKIEAGTLEFVNSCIDVNEMCEDIVRSSQLKAQAGVEVIFESYRPSCNFKSDRNRIHQVLMNLINNAIKFTSSGSIRVGYYVHDKEIEFYVQDTGIGISKEKIAHIFERFVKLNTFIQGTGLGLSICKSIIEQMNGRIGVESELNKGSRFWFVVPYIEDKIEKNSIKNINIKLQMTNTNDKPVVLVAEDTDSNYLLVSTILRKEYDVKWAKDGLEAIAMCSEINPDLILMDLKMPNMDGLEATKKIRETNKNVPIIALTAYAFEKDRIDAMKVGCNDFITKPIMAAKLLEKVRTFTSAQQ